MTINHIWAERYRPKTLDDCILPEAAKTQLNQIKANGEVPNLLLAGDPGIGKTSAAIALLEDLDCEWIKINASIENGIDTLRYKVMNFASTVSLLGGRKFVLFDEADKMSQAMQDGLRAFIEEFTGNCGFIFTCNHPNKLETAIRSRLDQIDFVFSDKTQLAKQAFAKVIGVLDDRKVNYVPKDVQVALVDHFSRSTDIRQLMVKVQKWSVTGEFKPDLSSTLEKRFDTLKAALKTKKFVEMRTWVGENADIPAQAVFDWLYENDKHICKKGAEPILTIHVAKYAYQNAFVINPEINVAACLTEIMADCI